MNNLKWNLIHFWLSDISRPHPQSTKSKYLELGPGYGSIFITSSQMIVLQTCLQKPVNSNLGNSEF